ncbi:MAG: hypothetical protein SPG69_11600, partial [Bacteroides pyogenes]|uniref:hypothetical protein n=1 Tax=Bacteroides pyogenes TaxID=310300 RepID=UPI002A91FA0B
TLPNPMSVDRIKAVRCYSFNKLCVMPLLICQSKEDASFRMLQNPIVFDFKARRLFFEELCAFPEMQSSIFP